MGLFAVIKEQERNIKKQLSALDTAKSAVGSATQIINGMFAREDFLISDEDLKERRRICSECSSYDAEKDRCLECGCLMNIKSKFNSVSCSLGKW